MLKLTGALSARFRVDHAHAASKKQEQAVSTVTGKVYNHSKRMKEKRPVLDGLVAELRRIIGRSAQFQPLEIEMRPAA
jgi:Tfp pilus assembly PilM family ATPase